MFLNCLSLREIWSCCDPDTQSRFGVFHSLTMCAFKVFSPVLYMYRSIIHVSSMLFFLSLPDLRRELRARGRPAAACAAAQCARAPPVRRRRSRALAARAVPGARVARSRGPRRRIQAPLRSRRLLGLHLHQLLSRAPVPTDARRVCALRHRASRARARRSPATRRRCCHHRDFQADPTPYDCLCLLEFSLLLVT